MATNTAENIKNSSMTELTEGNKAPAFDMPINGGSDIKLNELSGKNIVLYFYPKDDTPGCTTEAKDFTSLIKEFEKLDTIIIGVSKDSVEKHDKFQEKYDIAFPLASDEGIKTIQDYGVWKEKKNYGKTYMGIERSTFLIDKKGIIRQIWRKVKVAGHAEKVLEAVKGL
ncbi:MAG: thioredoxin-dependent thiol peroxidase [Rickettsiales bacterium]